MAETNMYTQYGIKEVADITFYQIGENGEPGDPVLFIDSAKTTNLETTGEEAVATGGKGNAELISWDHSRKGTFTISDALFSMNSLGLMIGCDVANEGKSLDKVHSGTILCEITGTAPAKTIDGRTVTYASTTKIYDPDDLASPMSGTTTSVEGITAGKKYYVSWKDSADAKAVIAIDAIHYPGTYYVTAETIIRNRATGKDEAFQIVLPKAKVQSNTNINLDAGGDPTVFDMTLKLLKDDRGDLVRLVKYGDVLA